MLDDQRHLSLRQTKYKQPFSNSWSRSDLQPCTNATQYNRYSYMKHLVIYFSLKDVITFPLSVQFYSLKRTPFFLKHVCRLLFLWHSWIYWKISNLKDLLTISFSPDKQKDLVSEVSNATCWHYTFSYDFPFFSKCINISDRFHSWMLLVLCNTCSFVPGWEVQNEQ